MTCSTTQTNLATLRFIVSVLSGKFDAVRLLCSTPGLQVNKKDKLGRTALGLAIEWKQGRIVALLRTSGGVLAEEEEERMLSGQQIYDACENGDVNDLQALLAKWGDTSASVNWTKIGLIVCAPATDLNKPTSAGLTPLMLCAEYGRAAIAKQLIHENSSGRHHRGALRMDGHCRKQGLHRSCDCRAEDQGRFTWTPASRKPWHCSRARARGRRIIIQQLPGREWLN